MINGTTLTGLAASLLLLGAHASAEEPYVFVLGIAQDAVYAGTAVDAIVAHAADQVIVLGFAEQYVVAGHAVDGVITKLAVKLI